MKNLAILGSTGSIGVSTLDVAGRFPDRFRVKALACGGNVALLEKQVREFSPELVSVREKKDADALRKAIGRTATKIAFGIEGLVEAASLSGVEKETAVGWRPSI